jgi:hypothetical protein
MAFSPNLLTRRNLVAILLIVAGVAQLAEHSTCNREVVDSISSTGSNLNHFFVEGYPSWPKGADCKSVGNAFEGSNPSPSTTFLIKKKRIKNLEN